jgi:hypothetical protein
MWTEIKRFTFRWGSFALIMAAMFLYAESLHWELRYADGVFYWMELAR